jgi:predicted aspartyl protease
MRWEGWDAVRGLTLGPGWTTPLVTGLSIVVLSALTGCSTVSSPPSPHSPSRGALSQAESYCDKIFKTDRNVAMMAVFENDHRICYQKRSVEVGQSAVQLTASAPAVQLAESYCDRIFNQEDNAGIMAVFANSFDNCVAVRSSELASTMSMPRPVGIAMNAAVSTGDAGVKEVGLRIHSGILAVPVSINNAITLDFIIDSGASDVSIPADVVLTLMRAGTILPGDFLGERTYMLADGSTVPSATFRIRSLRVGDRQLADVTGSVAPVRGSLLLGQSFLRRFRSWSIDNWRQVLVLE